MQFYMLNQVIMIVPVSTSKGSGGGKSMSLAPELDTEPTILVMPVHCVGCLAISNFESEYSKALIFRPFESSVLPEVCSTFPNYECSRVDPVHTSS